MSDVQKLAQAIADAVAPFLDGEAKVDFGDDKDNPGVTKFTRAKLEKMSVAKLRRIAIQEDFEEEEVAEADKDEIIAALLGEDSDDDDADDDSDEDDSDDDDDSEDEDDDDEDEDEGEDGEYDRDELEAMSQAQLKKLAKEAGYETADLRGKDVDALVDLLLGEDDEDEDDEDADDEADDDEDGDDEELTEEDLEAMDLNELKELAEEWGVELKPRMRKQTIIDALLEAE